ncbi:cytochrome c maturation protein CcmE [Nisaea acidiphila]|uniref:Cytochrome c-type biogenesis protein CcmE n=1 Tax=Nisaea acidiphila TaxID=1862145 RepID=A0A9J7AVT1_9PROT|nr:cytochrome c maturation protein CcmE [Nisaea acidiphila]UUX51447.1 cytochrome c maturation protein CcmE [Nisaea acidiphila]
MTPKRRRLSIVLIGLTMLGAAVALVLTAFEENLVFFFSPTELQAKEIGPDRRIRIGGLVAEDSVASFENGLRTEFTVTDLEHSVKVVYRGALPDLFREGQGVVAEGKFASGVFTASEVLAKHDENYMPREVADALKKSGRWQHATENQ